MAKNKKIKAIIMISDSKGGYVPFDSLSESDKKVYSELVAKKAGEVLSRGGMKS